MAAPYIKDEKYGIIPNGAKLSSNHLLRSKLFERVSQIYIDFTSASSNGTADIYATLKDGDTSIAVKITVLRSSGILSISSVTLIPTLIDGQATPDPIVLPWAWEVLEAKEYILTLWQTRDEKNLSLSIGLKMLEHPTAEATTEITLLEKTFASSIRVTGDYGFVSEYYVVNTGSLQVLLGLAEYEARNQTSSVLYTPAEVITEAPIAAPTITEQPESQSKTYGQQATFGVTASGSGTLTYQWRLNGENIEGATSSSYQTPVLTMEDSGNVYDCVVSNEGGDTESDGALLTVTQVIENSYKHLGNNVGSEEWQQFISIADGQEGMIEFGAGTSLFDKATIAEDWYYFPDAYTATPDHQSTHEAALDSVVGKLYYRRTGSLLEIYEETPLGYFIYGTPSLFPWRINGFALECLSQTNQTQPQPGIAELYPSGPPYDDKPVPRYEDVIDSVMAGEPVPVAFDLKFRNTYPVAYPV